MSRWKKLAGLFVEMDGSASDSPSPDESGSPTSADEIERILASTRSDSGAAPPQPAEPPPPPPAAPMVAGSVPAAPGSGCVPEGVAFPDIYAAAAVPASPQPAEKLLKVLDGLAALPVPTRVAAVQAMDAADDAWTVADTLLDAQRKIQALQDETARLTRLVQDHEVRAQSDLAKEDAYLTEATALIQKQIAELQTQLQQETTAVAERKLAIQSGLQSSREALQRENSRLNAEMMRLNQIVILLGNLPPSGV